MRQELEALITLHEGLRLMPYRCPAGKLTIGVGHNLDAKGITREQALAILDADLRDASGAVKLALPWSEALDDVRFAVLVDMAFNMGIGGLLKFRNTLSFVHDGDYEAAATEMLKSAWAQQVGARAKRLSEMMRTGEWPQEVMA